MARYWSNLWCRYGVGWADWLVWWRGYRNQTCRLFQQKIYQLQQEKSEYYWRWFVLDESSYADMKLLLTSNGLSNQNIADTLFEMVGKAPEETHLTFIPTASNVEVWDKWWLINDLWNLKKQNFKSIDIVDISAVDESIRQPSLEKADVILFWWGNTFHLMQWIEKSGVSKILPKLLENKVYVGISAGSMVTAQYLDIGIAKCVYGEQIKNKKNNIKGLDFVNFYFLPHLNDEYFENMRKENIEQAVQDINQMVYALDNHSALKVVNGTIEVVGEWERLVFNP